MIRLISFIGNFIFFISKTFNLGAGGTWPGEIALRIKSNILTDLARLKIAKEIILVAGTNGKTTTSLLIKTVLKKNGQTVIHNTSGANLLNGLVSTLLISKNADFAVFEVDENSLPQVLKFIKPQMIILLNLFRDQLDRYGEVDIIGNRWLKSLRELRDFGEFEQTTIIINADDPCLAFIGKNLKAKTFYFGLKDKKLFLPEIQHATDSLYCPNCQNKLDYEGTFFSHLGIWQCGKCGLRRPKTDLGNLGDLGNFGELKGVYNQYNLLAAVLALKTLGVEEETIKKGFKSFQPAFGRGEELVIDGKKIKIFLSKNPTGFNESLRTVVGLGAQNFLFVLNDRIPDGRDVSWIWDVDFEMIGEIGVSGDRAYDMALRLKYGGIRDFRVFGDIREAIKNGLEKIKKDEILYILPTYSAMLEVRKILGGRKIL